MLFKGGVFGTSVRNSEASAEDNASSVVTADLNTKIDWEIPASYPTTLRDPMQLGPAATDQTQTETETRTFVKLIVKGILYTEDNQSAVIGNHIVHEGEEIRGVTVVKISKDSVEFEMNGKRWTQKVR
jgi:type II secretory pathway component PulC